MDAEAETVKAVQDALAMSEATYASLKHRIEQLEKCASCNRICNTDRTFNLHPHAVDPSNVVLSTLFKIDLNELIIAQMRCYIAHIEKRGFNETCLTCARKMQEKRDQERLDEEFARTLQMAEEAEFAERVQEAERRQWLRNY